MFSTSRLTDWFASLPIDWSLVEFYGATITGAFVLVTTAQVMANLLTRKGTVSKLALRVESMVYAIELVREEHARTLELERAQAAAAKAKRDSENPFGKEGWNLTKQSQMLIYDRTEAYALAAEAGIDLNSDRLIQLPCERRSIYRDDNIAAA